jgi:hypothetical protein
MRFIRFIMLVLIGLNSIAYAANKDEKSASRDAKKSTKEEKHSLRFAWWELPTNIPDLYILSGNKYISIAPRNLSMSTEVSLSTTEGNVDLLRKLISEEKDNNGRPKESYEVYSSINLAQVDSRELGILLVPNKQKNVAGARVFDFSTRGFPYGSFIIVNFTRGSKITCTVDDTKFSVTPGTFSVCPKIFTSRSIAYVDMTAIDANGLEDKIVSTKSVFKQGMRTLYFVIDSPQKNLSKYDVRCIIDIDLSPTKSSDSNNSSDQSKDKPVKS